MESAKLSVAFFKLNQESRIGICLPLDKVGGIMLAFRAFLAQAYIIPIEPQRKPLAALEEEVLSFISLVPNQVAAEQAHWHKAETMLIGGGPIHSDLEKKLVQFDKSNFWHSYASTETISHVALRAIGSDVYKGLDGVRFSQHKDNCLQIDAPSLGLKSIKTKDIVDLIDEHQFKWKGRVDNVVLSGGLKIYPEDLESIFSLPVPFFFAGADDSELGQRLIIAIRAQDFQDSLREMIRSLNGANRPKAILILEDFIYTSTGKIRRQASLLKLISTIEL